MICNFTRQSEAVENGWRNGLIPFTFQMLSSFLFSLFWLECWLHYLTKYVLILSKFIAMFRSSRVSLFHPNRIATAISIGLLCPVYPIDPYSRGGLNIEWKMRPNRESMSHLLGWRDLESFRILRADDSHHGDRFGRTVVLRGSFLVVGAGAVFPMISFSFLAKFIVSGAHRRLMTEACACRRLLCLRWPHWGSWG